MTDGGPRTATFLRPTRINMGLANALGKRGFRHAYMARQLKTFLADQLRTLRGALTQSQFGEIIGKPQSVVSRIEKQADRNISIQTLIDIAERLDIALIIRFVDFPTFLRYTEDYSDEAMAPARFKQDIINNMVKMQNHNAQTPETAQDFIQRQSDAQHSQASVDLARSSLQVVASPANQKATIASGQVIPLRPYQQGIDERSMRNVGQPQRLAS